MLQHFRKPKWRHSRAAVRRQAVDQLSALDAEQAGILRSLAIDDDDPGVRRAAIRKLSSLELLRERIQEDPDSGVAEAAAVRYRQILAGGSGADDDLQARIKELDHCPNPRVLAHVVRGAREEALRIAALERCSDESLIADAAVNDPVARVRQSALGWLEDAAALQRVAERTRNSDRKISRLARDKLRAGEERAQAQAARAGEREAVIEALRAITDADTAPRAGELARLENRWQAVAEDAGAVESERFGTLLANCRRLAERGPAVSLAQGDAPATAELRSLWHTLRDAEEPRPDQVEALAAALEQAGDMPDEVELADPRSYVQAARRYLETRPRLETLLARLQGPDEATAEAAGELRDLLEQVQWPRRVHPPQTLQHCRDALEAAPVGADSAPAEPAPSPQREAALQEQLHAVDEALQQGNLRGAQRALRKARDLVDEMPSRAAAGPERSLRRYTARVAELRDWRRFATLPKQEQLCEQMEALVGADMPPPELATAIKALQDEWKETGGSDSTEARQLWERFQAASDRAFEPCRAYFDEQARQRDANLAERERISGQLETFMSEADWDNLGADRLVAIRGKAREEWNHFSPVPRGSGKALSRRFESLMDQLSERIRDKQERNRRQKAELLEQARALHEMESQDARLKEAKALQARWRGIGAAQPAQDRKLYRAFKSACDAVFAERDQDRQAERERRERSKAQAEQLCERLEALSEGEAEDAQAIRQDLGALEQEFRELGPLPRGVGEGVERRFRKAAQGVRDRLGRLEALEIERTYERLRRYADICHRLEAAAQGNDDSTPEQLEAEWAAMESVPEALGESLSRRWARARRAAEAGGFSDEECEAAVARARRLCVGMEILGGVESPDADADLRMQVQVERLSEGLVSGDASRESAAETVRTMELEWLGNGPLPDEVRTELETRFHAARDAALREAQAA